MIPETQTTSQLLTVEEVVKRLNISRKTLYSLRKDGEISTVLIKNSVRFTEAEVDRFIQESQKPKIVAV